MNTDDVFFSRLYVRIQALKLWFLKLKSWKRSLKPLALFFAQDSFCVFA